MKCSSTRLGLGLQHLVFIEHELTFTFAICHRPSVCLSVVCLSVGDRPRETLRMGSVVYTIGVAKYSDFGAIERYISETVQYRSYVCINH